MSLLRLEYPAIVHNYINVLLALVLQQIAHLEALLLCSQSQNMRELKFMEGFVNEMALFMDFLPSLFIANVLKEFGRLFLAVFLALVLLGT